MPTTVGLITEYYLDCSVYYEHLYGSSEDTAKIQIPCVEETVILRLTSS